MISFFRKRFKLTPRFKYHYDGVVQPVVHSEQVVATRNNKCIYNPDLNHKLLGQLLKRFIGYMYNVVMSLDNVHNHYYTIHVTMEVK